MVKVFVLLLMVLLTFMSIGGYLFMDGKIVDGERQIANGQKQIEEGQPELEAGKVKLEAGKIESSEGKKEYEKAEDNLFLVLVDDLFNAGKGFKEGRDRIAEGDRQVANGVDNVNVGERRLDAGRLQLLRGKEQVGIAKGARILCVLGAVFFAIVTIVLGLCWRRTMIRVFMHPRD